MTTLIGVSAVSMCYLLYLHINKGSKVDGDSGSGDEGKKAPPIGEDVKQDVDAVILYGTVTGTARIFALELEVLLRDAGGVKASVMNISEYNPELLENEKRIVILICSTWSDGQPPDVAKIFYDWVQDFAYDFRVGNNALSKVIIDRQHRIPCTSHLTFRPLFSPWCF